MEKNKLSKEKILKYAREIIETEGLPALNVTKIVTNFKISKSTFYKHFSSKEDLISELKASSNSNESDFYSTREKILLKAIEEFSNNPFEKIDMDTIAKAAGLKRTSIYRYFSSKEELLEASLKNEIRNRKNLDEYLKSIPYDPHDYIEKLLEYSLKFSSKKYNNLVFHNALYFSEINSNIKNIMNDLWNCTIELIENYFEIGRQKGLFKSDIDSKALAKITFSFLGGLAIFSHEDYSDLGKQFIELLYQDIKK